MKKIYIASPYTLGDVGMNVKKQLDAADELMANDFAPFVPIYYHFQHIAHPRPYQDWMNQCYEWVKVCDALVRLEGESKGADSEVDLAIKLNIPVFYSIEEVVMHFRLSSVPE